MRENLKEFRQFLLRGNVVDLAVAVVIGAAFGAVVASLVADLITPIIAAIIGKPDFSNLTFTINGSGSATARSSTRSSRSCRSPPPCSSSSWCR